MAAKRPVCAYDEATHTYTLDGVPVPSVSHVLKVAGLSPDYRGINPAILAYAAARGTYVEGACRLDDLGELDEEAMHPAARGYLAAWRAFRQKTNFHMPFEHQVRLYHPVLGYAGTADIVSPTRVLDIKCTSKIAPTYRLQLAAYTMPGLYREDGTQQGAVPSTRDGANVRGVVQLLPTGKYVYEEYDDDVADYDTFRAALQIARWRHAMNNGKA